MSRTATRRPARSRKAARTLAIDIGGTGTKMLVLDARGRPLTERARELTPKPAQPKAVLAVLRKMLAAQPAFDRISVGFPGVVADGVVKTAPNLGTPLWRDFDFGRALEKLAKKPVRVVNDCDLQGLGVVEGRGVEMVLTLGTGLGSALFVDGKLLPNLELGHHPFYKQKTYEQRIANVVLQKIGKRRWTKRVLEMLETLERIFNYDVLWLGGGNAKKLRAELPSNVRRFENVAALAGGLRLWQGF